MLVTGLFLGIYAFLEAPREIGRWHMAAANEFWVEAEIASLKGDSSRAAENREQAFAKLDDALKWSVDEPNWVLQRAKWRLEAGQLDEALADCNTLLSQRGDEPALLLARMEINQQLGRHADAVKDAELVNAISKTSGIPSRGDALNTLAYVKAVANVDLKEALIEAEECVADATAAAQREPNDINAKLTLALRQDTRGFLQYQLGHYAPAYKDIDAACKGMDEMLRDTSASFDAKRRGLPDPRMLDILLASRKKASAVVIYHRALVHEKLGHSAAAAADRKRVRELIGRDGDEKLF